VADGSWKTLGCDPFLASTTRSTKSTTKTPVCVVGTKKFLAACTMVTLPNCFHVSGSHEVVLPRVAAGSNFSVRLTTVCECQNLRALRAGLDGQQSHVRWLYNSGKLDEDGFAGCHGRKSHSKPPPVPYAHHTY
jgi:hypothetical protein